MDKTIIGILLEVSLGIISIAILLAWYDIFCENKVKQKNLIISIIGYVCTCILLEHGADYIIQKYFESEEMLWIIVKIIQFLIETTIEWCLFISRYKGSTWKKIALYVPYIIVIPVMEMFLQSIINKDLILARINSYYIAAFNDVTLFLTMYLIILIFGEIYRFRKYKNHNPHVLLFVIMLVAQLTVHYFFEKEFLTMANEHNMKLYLMGYSLSAIIFLCISEVYRKHLKELEYKRLEKERQRLWEQRIEYHQTTGKTVKEWQRIGHDFKKYLLIISQLLQANKYDELNDYLEKVLGHVTPSTQIVEAENTIVSSALTIMVARCKEMDINFQYQLRYRHLAISDLDLSIILGNILENAFEASVKVSDISKRNIRLSIQEDRGIVLISCKNYYLGNIEVGRDGIKTSKLDNGSHGLGIINIKKAIEAYDGNVDIATVDNSFEIHIVLDNPI